MTARAGSEHLSTRTASAKGGYGRCFATLHLEHVIHVSDRLHIEISASVHRRLFTNTSPECRNSSCTMLGEAE
jgi:hypothetical protein